MPKIFGPKETTMYKDLFSKKIIKIYYKANKDNYVTDIDSEVFLRDTTGWLYLTCGRGDRYVYARTKYLKKPLIDENGNYNYTVKDMALEMVSGDDNYVMPEAQSRSASK